MLKAYRIAERYGRLPRGSYNAQELVADVIYELAVGDLRSDPAQPIAPQVERHVQRRAARLRERENARRPRRPRFVPLDIAPDVALAVELDPPSLVDDVHHAIDHGEWAARVRAYASGDAAAQQLLALYDQDNENNFSRRAALDAGMTEWAYRTARQRLIEYAIMARADMSPDFTELEPLRDPTGAPSPLASAAGSARQSPRASRVVSDSKHNP
jgi:hypothetical protein